MNDIDLQFGCAHYGLYGNVPEVSSIGVMKAWSSVTLDAPPSNVAASPRRVGSRWSLLWMIPFIFWERRYCPAPVPYTTYPVRFIRIHTQAHTRERERRYGSTAVGTVSGRTSSTETQPPRSPKEADPLALCESLYTSSSVSESALETVAAPWYEPRTGSKVMNSRSPPHSVLKLL